MQGGLRCPCTKGSIARRRESRLALFVEQVTSGPRILIGNWIGDGQGAAMGTELRKESGRIGSRRRRLNIAAALVAVSMLAGCSVHVHKNEYGEDKDVSIHTPFGGMQVHKGTDGVVDTGLPVYPGAVPETKKRTGDDKSVDLALGFGPFQMRVQVASYTSADPQEKVEAFYRKALASYGNVLLCRGNAAVGNPDRTEQGLTCSDKDHGQGMNLGDDGELQLKAGSERKQHIVGFKKESEPGTHFALIALALPPGAGSSQAGNRGSEAEE